MYLTVSYFTMLTIEFMVIKFHKEERSHIIEILLTLIFFPVSAMHAMMHITKSMYVRFDYIALTAIYK